MESLRGGWGEGLGRPMSRDLLPRTRAGLDGRFPKGCDDPTAACFGFNAPIQTCLKQPQPWRWWGCGSRNRPCWFGFLQAISFAARHTASLHHHRNPGVSAQAAGPTGAGGHWPELSAGCGPRRLRRRRSAAVLKLKTACRHVCALHSPQSCMSCLILAHCIARRLGVTVLADSAGVGFGSKRCIPPGTAIPRLPPPPLPPPPPLQQPHPRSSWRGRCRRTASATPS